ncbi:MAG: hydroxymethylbilane synthase [Parachlamydiaceae bacterium]|nr:hydroxymethylbilane synthase [Parachlamydiaceae bacterium]
MPLSINIASKIILEVGARTSPLSRVQVNEIFTELQQFHSNIHFNVHFTSTVGDKDQQTSLRLLDKTNFFTKEIDEMILNGCCRIGIHSAKDLPHPIPDGLEIICLTKGIDPSDSLVLREGDKWENLAQGSLIATSSNRREEVVKQMRKDLCFCDIRGTIDQRLEKLQRFEVDGVVIAEAAIIRLRLTHLNRIKLPGSTAEGQGQLAIVAKSNDEEMKQLFHCIDSRKVYTTLG